MLRHHASQACLAAFLVAGSMQAAGAASDEPLPRYQRSGAGFACVWKGTVEDAKPSADSACLRIGPFRLDMTRAEVEKITTTPVASMKTDRGEAFAYPLIFNDQNDMVSYLVVVYSSDDRADSVQLTGAPFRNSWTFSGLTLGDAREAILALFGEPKKTSESEDSGAVQWSYRPWTFSFEVKNNVISSIRIAKSEAGS